MSASTWPIPVRAPTPPRKSVVPCESCGCVGGHDSDCADFPHWCDEDRFDEPDDDSWKEGA